MVLNTRAGLGFASAYDPAYAAVVTGSCQCVTAPCQCAGAGGTGGGDSSVTDLTAVLPAWYQMPLPGSGVSIIDLNNQTVARTTVTGAKPAVGGMDKNTLWLLAAAAVVVVMVARR